jgi:hypothetical protein
VRGGSVIVGHDQLLRSAGQCPHPLRLASGKRHGHQRHPVARAQRRLFGLGSALFSASTVGQAGTLAAETSVTAQDLLLASKTRITGTASTNAATGAAGTVTLTVLYSVEG